MMRYRPLALLLLLPAFASAEEWPQWLGPRRDNSSSEIVKPWTEKPRLLWSVSVPSGHSAPVVADGLVVLHTAGTTPPDGKPQDTPLIEQLTAYDAVKGEVRWVARYPKTAFSSQFGTGPRATPVVRDGRIYSLGVTGTLAVTELKSGKRLVESVDTSVKFAAAKLTFGVSASPLIEDGKLIVLVGGKGASVVAFDPQTLAVTWQSESDAPSYASPVVVDSPAGRQIVALTGAGVVALSPTDGKLAWRVPFKDVINESSTTPVKVGDTVIASSVTLGSVALKLGPDAPAQQWKIAGLNCYFSTPVASGDHVYFVTGKLLPPPSVTLRCVEPPTGKVLWSKPNVGQYHAALLKTGDGKLLMLEDGGGLALVEPSATEYKELCRAKVCGHTWAHPIISDGRLYLRDEKELFCYELPK